MEVHIKALGVAELSELFRNSFDGVAVLRHHRVVYANTAFCQMFNLPCRDVAGKLLQDLLPSAIKPELLPAGGSGGRMETVFSLPDRHGDAADAVQIALRSEIVPTDDGEMIVLFFHDFTPHLLSQMSQRRFMANINHELRTPVNGIFGMLQLLETTELDDLQKSYLDLARGATDRLREVLENILNFSMSVSGDILIRLETCDLLEVLNSAKSRLSSRLSEAGVNLEISGERADPAVCSDAAVLSHIAFRLLQNSLEFSGGGTVRIALRDGREGFLEMVLTDEGSGIEAASIEDAFRPYHQLEDPYTKHHGGTGLGLAIVKALCDSLGIEIRVNAARGRGVEFLLAIPRRREDADRLRRAPAGSAGYPGPTAPAAAPAAADESPERTPPQGHRTVLLVEDEEVNSLYLRTALSARGLSVTHVYSGTDAVAVARDLKPDLILMDIGLPDISGLEASRRILAMPGFEDLPIIAVTAHILPDDRRACYAAGIREIVMKPCDISSLMGIIGAQDQSRNR
jgi:signal transduction histidine kinase/CheY-like chemotaxis protein